MMTPEKLAEENARELAEGKARDAAADKAADQEIIDEEERVLRAALDGDDEDLDEDLDDE